jgi:chitinase
MATRRLLTAATAALALSAGLLAPVSAANASSAADTPAAENAAAGSGDRHGHEGYLKVGYFTQWGIYGRGFLVNNLVTSGSAARMTHLNYAFGNVNADGVCASADPWADYQTSFSAQQSVDGVADTAGQPLAGNFNQLRELKKKYPDLKVQISLGGWTLSKYFSDAVATDAARKKFAASCVDLFIKGNLPQPGGEGAAAGVFDGIDFDWEWPGSPGNDGNIVRPEDRQNFTLALQEFRHQLDAYGRQTRKHYSMTAFLAADPKQIDNGYEVGKVFRTLDFATVQGYDMHGTWEPVTNHQSALYPPAGEPQNPDFTVSRAVDALLSRGAPRSKLVVGVPFYGRGWTDVASTANHGLFQNAPAAAPGSAAAGYEDYRNLKLLQSNGFTLYRDRRAGFSWLFDGKTFWTYDDPTVMAWKAEYIKDHDLAGAMAWSLDADDERGSLMAALDRNLD